MQPWPLWRLLEGGLRCCMISDFFSVSKTVMGLTPKSRDRAPLPLRALATIRCCTPGRRPWCLYGPRNMGRGPSALFPPLALGAMALLAIPHALDTPTGRTMDRYIGHSVSNWRPEQMGHSTSLSTHVKHPRRDVRKDVTRLTSPSGHITFF